LFEELLFFYSSQRVLHILDCSLSWLEVFRTPLLVYLESVNLRLVEVDLRREHYCFRVMLQKHVREGGTKVSAVDVNASEFWKVDFFASRAEDLKPRSLESVTKPYWKYFLLIAKCSRAVPEQPRKELLVNLGNPSWSLDVSSMD
jgi:hypothetical protein